MANLNDIKDYLLGKYPQFNAGYANVVKLHDKDIMLDEDKQLYAGIEDTKGNYFYIRELKQPNFEAMKRGARVPYYQKTSACRIVGIAMEWDVETMLKMLINGVNAKRHFVTGAQIESTQVFKDETGHDLTRKELTIVAVDFNIIEVVSPRDCSLNPCTC